VGVARRLSKILRQFKIISWAANWGLNDEDFTEDARASIRLDNLSAVISGAFLGVGGIVFCFLDLWRLAGICAISVATFVLVIFINSKKKFFLAKFVQELNGVITVTAIASLLPRETEVFWTLITVMLVAQQLFIDHGRKAFLFKIFGPLIPAVVFLLSDWITIQPIHLTSDQIFIIRHLNQLIVVVFIFSLIQFIFSRELERKRIAVAIEHEKSKLIEDLARNIPGMIHVIEFRLDGTLKTTYASEGCKKLYGVAADEVVNGNLRLAALLHPEHLESWTATLKSAVKELKSGNWKGRFILADGTDRWVSNSYTPTVMPDGTIRINSIHLDITQEKNLEIELKKSQQELILGSKMSSLGEMAAGMAHEINNPLAIISLRISQVQARLRSENPDLVKVQDDLLKVLATVGRIAKIVGGLRSFSRNSDNDPMQVTRFRAILEDTLEFCRERFTYKSIDLRLTHIEDASIECRPSQISQVLLNLLNNSFDAIVNETAPWVEIQAVVKDKQLMISITDSGPGIAPEIAFKLMQPFFTTKEVGKGTGLGLSISKGFIEDHQGKFYYDSTSKNTRFMIELPISLNKVS
jgi:PAS domain S-box-containing protein